MLQYKSEYLRDPYIKELKHSLYSCYRYEIRDSTAIVSTIYASQNLTLIYCGEHILRVERKKRLFAKPHHFFYDNNTGKQIGVFEFPDWQFSSRTRCLIRFNSGLTYSFTENRNPSRLFKPSTWNLYSFEMSNSETYITYYGSRDHGTIETNIEDSLIPVSLGFYIIDDKIRSWEESG